MAIVDEHGAEINPTKIFYKTLTEFIESQDFLSGLIEILKNANDLDNNERNKIYSLFLEIQKNRSLKDKTGIVKDFLCTNKQGFFMLFKQYFLEEELLRELFLSE